MSGGALEELGVSPEAVEECGIYQALLKVIDKRNLQAHHGTLHLVLALKELVFIRQRTGNRNGTFCVKLQRRRSLWMKAR